jgi:hypothetical protein
MMDEALRSESTHTLEELVDALLVAANYGANWEAEGAARARQITEHLGLTWHFTDWQDALDTIGKRAVQILEERVGGASVC